MSELVEKACSICGRFNCTSCIVELTCIEISDLDTKDERRLVKKFREQVRDKARRDKRLLRF